MRTFEDWFEQYENKNEYAAKQIALDAYELGLQHRQTEVDELKLDYSKAKLSDIRHASLARDVIFERDELQKRVDAVKQLIQEYHQHSYREADDFVFYLEQALKGVDPK